MRFFLWFIFLRFIFLPFIFSIFLVCIRDQTIGSEELLFFGLIANAIYKPFFKALGRFYAELVIDFFF